MTAMESSNYIDKINITERKHFISKYPDDLTEKVCMYESHEKGVGAQRKRIVGLFARTMTVRQWHTRFQFVSERQQVNQHKMSFSIPG